MKRWIAAIVALTSLNGCATVNRMAFDQRAAAIDTSAQSVILMVIDVWRDDDSRFVPNPFVVKIERPGAQTKEERQNFKVDRNDDTVEEAGHRIYLARMALAPGRYTVQEIVGNANAFPINSLFNVPLVVPLDVAPNAIIYLGRVTARLRPRRDGEFRAGPLIPLVDQAIAGMSNGTWDIAIDDRSEQDLRWFRSQFNALRNATIDVQVLPPFDRALIQRLWDGETSASPAPVPPPAGTTPSS